jgi:poly(3-hydroxybutyrate) depolymerase
VRYPRCVNLCLAFLFASTLMSMGIVSAAAPQPQGDDYFLYIPTNAASRGPLQILVTVHGMGGDGKTFCQNLINRAEQDNWAIVSPTFNYHDYKNPDAVLQDDTTMLPHLMQIIDRLPQRTGLRFKDKVLVYGFSRGAQMAHRFAEFYPDRTLAVALFSAGSYTLPMSSMPVGGTPTPTMNLPFGVADLQQYTSTAFDLDAFKKVPFFIGVGGADNNPADTPRAWDAFEGQTRIARAQAFGNVLQGLGMEESVTVFPNVGHDVTNDMRGQAMNFLERQAFVATLAQQNVNAAHAFLAA